MTTDTIKNNSVKKYETVSGDVFDKTKVNTVNHQYYGETIQISVQRSGWAGGYSVTVTNDAAKRLVKKLIAELLTEEAEEL